MPGNQSEGIDKPITIVDEFGNPIYFATETTMNSVLTALNTLIAGQGQYTTLVSGRTVIATTGVAVPLASNIPCKKVIFSALETNQGVIRAGDSVVNITPGSETGIPLLPLNSKDEPIDNLNKIYINGNAGDGVSWGYYNN